MDILGSRAQGDKITAKVGGNLNIETLQEKETYEEHNSSTGFGISWGVKAKEKATSSESTDQAQNPPTAEPTDSTPKPNNTKVPAPTTESKFFAPTIGASWNKGNIDSHYRSAREQAGFFAGGGGFDIYVEKNTDLKGGVIASKASPDKNKLSTGTLSFSDLKNEADYSAKSIGAAYHKYGNYDNMSEDEQDKVYNTKGLAPNLSMPVKGDASSTTKAAIAPGTIDIRENPTQDISALSRDTANSLNELGKIFDKKTIEEQQELAAVFGEEAFRLLHNMKDDGSGRKIAAHAIIGGLMSQITGAGFASGAIGAGLNEALIKSLKGLDPGTAQIVSAVIGAAAAKAIDGNAQAGASAAASGTKWNYFLMEFPDIYPVETIAKETLKKNDGTTPSQEEIDQYIDGMHKTLSEQESALANSAWKQAENTDNYPKAIRYLMDAGITKESAVEFFKKYNETLRSSGWSSPETVAVEDGYWNRDVLVSKKAQSIRHSTSNIQQYERVTEIHTPKNFDGTNLVLPEKKTEFSILGSIGINSVTDVSNRLPDAVKREGHFVRPLSVYLKLGGVVGMGWTYRDMRKDWYTYSGTKLAIALGTDVLPTLFSAIGGSATAGSGPASIFTASAAAIAGSVAGDIAKYGLRKNFLKDGQAK